MAKNKPQPAYVSPQSPYENTSEVENIYEVPETEDIKAFRAFTPDTTLLKAALDADFENARRNVTDSYGAYSGIPSQVVRNRMRDESINDLEGKRMTALTEGNEAANNLKMAQLEATANLTKGYRQKQKQKQSGYNTTVVQPGGNQSNTTGSIISGAATIGGALIGL